MGQLPLYSLGVGAYGPMPDVLARYVVPVANWQHAQDIEGQYVHIYVCMYACMYVCARLAPFRIVQVSRCPPKARVHKAGPAKKTVHKTNVYEMRRRSCTEDPDNVPKTWCSPNGGSGVM